MLYKYILNVSHVHNTFCCRHELDCMKHLFKCHDYLENWMYLESVLSLKKGSDALVLWEKCYQNKKV